jgi:Pvc16 N-terminal domain
LSAHTVLREVSLRLREILLAGLAGDVDVGPDFQGMNAISLASPATVANQGGPEDRPALSLYLYQITPSGYLRNQPLLASGPDEQRYPPLPVDLRYLITPSGEVASDDLVILGRVIQLLEANNILRAAFLESDLDRHLREARLSFEPLPLEDLVRIWSAFNEPYRLSVAYVVRGVLIDSLRVSESGVPVRESLIDVRQIEAGTGA